MFFIYIIMGVLFTYVAFQSANETIWNPLTILLLLVAALDFFVAFKIFRRSLKNKNHDQ